MPFSLMAAILFWPHSVNGQENGVSITQHSAEAGERDWTAVNSASCFFKLLYVDLAGAGAMRARELPHKRFSAHADVPMKFPGWRCHACSPKHCSLMFLNPLSESVERPLQRSPSRHSGICLWEG
jgi:hypothetical protein